MVLVGNLLLANSIRDLVPDKKNGRLTLAILLGRKWATVLFAAAFLFSYVFEIALIFTQDAPWWTLLILLSLPEAIRAVRRFIGKTSPITMVPAMKSTSKALTIFGITLALAYLFKSIIQKFIHVKTGCPRDNQFFIEQLDLLFILGIFR